jgi:hypothetical protein
MKMIATRYTGISLGGVLVALATLIAAEPAFAAGHAGRHHATPAAYAYNTQANPNYGFGPRVRVHPHDVVSGDRIIGRDPDPFIRGEILRHYHNGWPD